MIGIYKIVNVVNQKIYVGSSNNLTGRKNGHWCDLRKKRHGNPKLQNAWNKYGEQSFVFEIIEKCIEEDLLTKEQNYIDDLKPFYNCLTICCYSRKGTKRSVETQRKLEVYRETERKEIIRISPKTYEIVATYKSLTEASKEFNIPISNLVKCCKKQGYYRTLKKYVWRYSDDYNIEEIKNSLNVVKKKTGSIPKQLLQIDKNTNQIIKAWSSAKEVSDQLQVLIPSLNNCINNRSKSAGGYKWKYKL